MRNEKSNFENRKYNIDFKVVVCYIEKKINREGENAKAIYYGHNVY